MELFWRESNNFDNSFRALFDFRHTIHIVNFHKLKLTGPTSFVTLP